MAIDKPDELIEEDVTGQPEPVEPNETIEERRETLDPEVAAYWQAQLDELNKKIAALEEETVYWKDRALKDKLTGLANYDFFKEQIQSEIDDVANPDKKTESLGIVFLDMNGLKQINDTLGHDVADEVIKRIAQIINEQIRQTDWAARRSGDEFLIVLGGVNESKIQQAFHSFQTRVNEAMAQPFVVAGHEVPTSVSMGFDSVLKNGEHKNWEAMASLAEERMYKAKQAFKNSQNQA